MENFNPNHSIEKEQGEHDFKKTDGKEAKKFDKAFKLIELQSLKNPGIRERYQALLPAIYDSLSEDDQIKLLADPVGFISEKSYFRGLNPAKVSELLTLKKMIPESGDYNGTAVFLTDSPYVAIQFMNDSRGNTGVLAIINPQNLTYLDPEKGIHDVSSQQFKKIEHAYIEQLPEHERKQARYTAIDNWDTKTSATVDQPWHTLSLRNEQPLSSVSNFIILDTISGDTLRLDPHNAHDIEKLNSLFHIK